MAFVPSYVVEGVQEFFASRETVKQAPNRLQATPHYPRGDFGLVLVVYLWEVVVLVSCFVLLALVFVTANRAIGTQLVDFGDRKAIRDLFFDVATPFWIQSLEVAGIPLEDLPAVLARIGFHAVKEPIHVPENRGVVDGSPSHHASSQVGRC